MAKKSELWVAAAGNELTCTVSLNDENKGQVIKIVLSGAVMPKNTYVTDLLLASIENLAFDRAEIDARDMVFFDEGTVNQGAVGCLLELIVAIVRSGRKVDVSVSEAFVREALESVLGRRAAFRKAVTIDGEWFSGGYFHPIAFVAAAQRRM